MQLLYVTLVVSCAGAAAIEHMEMKNHRDGTEDPGENEL
jgi:hypothetical protein